MNGDVPSVGQKYKSRCFSRYSYISLLFIVFLKDAPLHFFFLEAFRDTQQPRQEILFLFLELLWWECSYLYIKLHPLVRTFG